MSANETPRPIRALRFLCFVCNFAKHLAYIRKHQHYLISISLSQKLFKTLYLTSSAIVHGSHFSSFNIILALEASHILEYVHTE